MFGRLSKGAALAAMATLLGAGSASAVELTMYYPVSVGGPLTKVVDGMVADFEKANPDVKVNAIYAGNYDDTRVKALAAVKAGQPVQLSVLFSIDAYDLIEQDAVIPFDDVAKSADDKAWLNSFYPGLMANGVIGGKTWGIPFQRSTIVMYYNKDAFREAGLNPDAPPATWTQMVDAAKKLTKPDGSRWGIEIPSTGYAYWMFGALAKQNGELLMSADGTRTYFDKPNVVEALQFWRDLGAKHKVMPEGTVEWGTLRQQFVEGKTAMMWHSTGNLTAVKGSAKFDFGVSVLPGNREPGSPTGGGNFYLFKKSSPEERAAALKLVKFMTAPERAAEWSIATGYMGVSPAAYETPALKAYAKTFPPAAVARDQLKNSVAELSTYQGGRIRKALDDAIQATLTGAKPAKDALAEAQAQADRLLKPYR
ncbi:Glycerol-3-phosphate ABC transporter substrate-binding protein [uncultured Alphaproteobacteria bacterium]|uniref:Glycerol-3-phosphate ABC transporter substrate-binding protein n=1 Tax=uncultured Alphaproteobacteria bacterium TaxID=91750 RepID=A0A212J6S8_9PROT|nr:Glycerol-3-phosphate ABC transporter substrate-binding protein [uncultured Alphaproteobacteria bacterium]